MTKESDIIRMSEITSEKHYLRDQAETMMRVLATLTPREEIIVRWRLNLGFEFWQEKGIETLEQLAAYMKVLPESILRGERRAIRKLKMPLRAERLRKVGLNPHTMFIKYTGRAAERQRIRSVEHVLANVAALSPELITHFRAYHDDIKLIPFDVFEHLIGELLASWGWDEVRLVGRNSETSADILAGRFDSNLGERARYFIEVKRWKNRIGIEIINQVLGAMIDERPLFGWHAAMIVTVAGAKDMRKNSIEELRLKGVWIKDQLDLDRWLDGYEPSPSGLWLPGKKLGGKTI